MKLHANAALSRTAVGGWSSGRGRGLVAARPPRRPESASAPRRSGSPATGRRESGLLDRSSAPRHVANRTDERTVAAARGVAAVAVHRRPSSLSCSICRCSTVSGRARSGSGWASSGRLGLEPAQRYERERPGELIHIDVKKLGRIQGGAGQTHHRRPHASGRQRFKDRQRHRRGIAGWDARSRRRRRRDPPGLRRGAARRESLHGRRVLAPRDRVLRPPRHHRRARHHRQRLPLSSLPSHAVACRVLGVRHLRTRPYRPADQRQSRTVHPNPARRLGLRRDLQLKPTNAPQPLTAGSGTYNHRRRHSAIGRQAPITRLNNLLGTYS